MVEGALMMWRKCEMKWKCAIELGETNEVWIRNSGNGMTKRLKGGNETSDVQVMWGIPLITLNCEITMLPMNSSTQKISYGS